MDFKKEYRNSLCGETTGLSYFDGKTGEAVCDLIRNHNGPHYDSKLGEWWDW